MAWHYAVHIHLADLYLALIFLAVHPRWVRLRGMGRTRSPKSQHRLVSFQHVLIKIRIRHFHNPVARIFPPIARSPEAIQIGESSLNNFNYVALHWMRVSAGSPGRLGCRLSLSASLSVLSFH